MMQGIRMPQAGERWRIRVRNAETPPCPDCGYVEGSSAHGGPSKYDGTIVVVLGPCGGWLVCARCERRCDSAGYISVALELNHPTFGVTFAAAPYTWLEPLDEPQTEVAP